MKTKNLGVLIALGLILVACMTVLDESPPERPGSIGAEMLRDSKTRQRLLKEDVLTPMEEIDLLTFEMALLSDSLCDAERDIVEQAYLDYRERLVAKLDSVYEVW